MAITTTSLLPPPVQQAFNERLLAIQQPNLIHLLPAMKFRLPRNKGNILRMRRPNKLGTAKVPLGNSGVTPPSQSLSAVDIDVKVDWYGGWVEINEQVTLQAQDRPLTYAAMLLGQQLRETEDELIRDMLASTASVLNCVGGVNGDNPTEISRNDIDNIYRVLIGSDAKTIMHNIEGQDKFGTAPVRNAFLALCHTDLTQDLNGVSGFINASQYPSQAGLLQAEYGSAGNLRFLVTSIGSVSANASDSGNDVYNISCVGQEAYGIVDQDGANSEFIYRDPMYDGPLAQNSTAGWKTAFGTRILNELWVLNLRATLS